MHYDLPETNQSANTIGRQQEAPDFGHGECQRIYEKNSDNTKYGWISPDGKYFHCGYQGHNALAEKICFGMVTTDNAEYYLESHGWCNVYKSLFEDKYRVYVGDGFVITNAQMKVLLDMGLEDAEDLSNMLCRE